MYKLNILLLFYCYSTIAIAADKSAGDNNFCVIHEPKFNFLYNFTRISNPKEEIVLTHKYPNETIRMELCFPLKNKCNGIDGYGICLIKDNKQEKGIGKTPPKVINESGKIMFIFTGDDCTLQEKYTVTILMKCDYTVEGTSYPELFPHTEEQCNLYMVWKTALACGPRTQQKCTVAYRGSHYDLSPLTRYSDNYVIHTENRTSKIILNVCHSVIYEHNALCEKHSGACLHDSTKEPRLRYTNLGDVQKPPFMEDGHLKLEYQYGDLCKVQNITVPHIKTTISFICNFNSMDTIPEYVGGAEECDYQLIWKTAAACRVESLRNHSAITAGKCTVTNPLTNFIYNLQSLINQDFHAVTQNGTEYKFGICGSPSNMLCSSGTGVCLTKNGTSYGKVNTNLMWQVGGPYLNYTEGDLCENGQHRYTFIAFVCGPEGFLSRPVIMEESSCQLIIHWNTDLVCDKRVKCATDDDEINLISLTKSTSNYVVKVNGTEFHINICRPLVPTRTLTCAHGSAVCKASLNSKNEFVDEVSLGFPMESPTLNKNGQAVLRYSSGSPCPENPKKLISSSFVFPCRYNDKGFPEYKKYEDCTYMFEWKTSVTCRGLLGNWSSPCIIRDQLLSNECNLSLLYKEQKVHHMLKLGDYNNGSVIMGEKFCNHSTVRQGIDGYGLLSYATYYYNNDSIKLVYANGGKCTNNSSYTSVVRFICNEAMGIGEPKLLRESLRSAKFEWHTNVICATKSSSPKPTNTSAKDNNDQEYCSSRTSIAAGIELSVIILLAALLYFRDPDRRARLRSCLNNPCSSRRSSGRVQYCRVNTTEEARVLLDTDATHCDTDSDEDLLHA